MLGIRHLSASISCVTCFACKPETLDLDQWHGEYVLYENSPSLKVCGGTHRLTDDFVPFMADALDLDSGQILTYRWLEQSQLECNASLGCIVDGDVATSWKPFLPHELVHSLLTTLQYPYQPFFGEGIAAALDPLDGDGIRSTYLVRSSTMDTYGDPRSWMTMPTEELHYATAGAFVSFLLARHGPAKFLEFVSQLGTSRDMKVIEQTFGSVYDIELDVEAELFMIGAPCTDTSWNPMLYDCTGPEVPWDGALHLSDTMDCASDDVIGGYSPERTWPSVRAVTFSVPGPARYSIHLAGDENVGVQIGSCFDCPWQRDVTILRAGDLRSEDLKAGLYYVHIVGNSSKKSDYTLDILAEDP